MTDLITYSEVFHSPQGEGAHTGRNTVWLRYWGCNLSCMGFGQSDPTDPSTYEKPYLEFDVNSVSKLEDLPVWKFGCDSSYTWSKRFKHLNHADTADNIALKLMDLIRSDINPQGTFLHDRAHMETELAFTGGEPMLPVNQRSTIQILESLRKHPGGIMPGTVKRKEFNLPRYITFETNGTQQLSTDLRNYFNSHSSYLRILMSVSPKLFSVSGEKSAKAIRPDVVGSYANDISCKGQLKFVTGTEDRQWDELEDAVDKFRAAGVNWPIYVMPVGATCESQEDIAAQVADMAKVRGYHVAARVHAYIYGNKIGT